MSGGRKIAAAAAAVFAAGALTRASAFFAPLRGGDFLVLLAMAQTSAVFCMGKDKRRECDENRLLRHEPGEAEDSLPKKWPENTKAISSLSTKTRTCGVLVCSENHERTG